MVPNAEEPAQSSGNPRNKLGSRDAASFQSSRPCLTAARLEGATWVFAGVMMVTVLFVHQSHVCIH